MPCDDWRLVPYADDAHALTQMLCEACRALDLHRVAIPPALQAWWRTHRREDEARLRHDQAQAALERARAAALAKLTEEERRALGIRP